MVIAKKIIILVQKFGQRLSEIVKIIEYFAKKIGSKSWNYRSSYFTIYQF